MQCGAHQSPQRSHVEAAADGPRAPEYVIASGTEPELAVAGQVTGSMERRDQADLLPEGLAGLGGAAARPHATATEHRREDNEGAH